YEGDLGAIIRQLGPKLKRFFVDAKLDGITCSTAEVAKALASNPKVGSELESCYLHIMPDDPEWMYSLVCSYFPKLTHLEVTFLFGMQIHETVPPLVKLPNLYKLNYNPDLKKAAYDLNSITPLKQVKRLFLGTVADSSFDVD